MLNIKKLKEIEQSDDSHEWKVYLAALEYGKAGIYVIPLRHNSKATLPAKEGINLNSASRNKNTLEAWFHPDTGRYAGCNIGIATGKKGGVFAIDVDRAKTSTDVDGAEILDALVKEHGALPSGPVQRTPSEGFHYLFAWQENASSSTSKIGKNIDTRGGEELSFKGHIVAFPSVIEGQTYTWEEADEVEIPEIPPWVMDKMGIPWKKADAPRESSPYEFEIQIPLDQIERMLGYIDPDNLSYEEWLAVGQAINSQHPGQDGLDMWDVWSEKGERYKRGECSKRWNGFDPEGPVRHGTLQYFARKGGWIPGPEDKQAAPFEEEIARMNETWALVNVGDKIRVLREIPTPPDLAFPRWKLVEKDAFRALFANQIIMVTAPDAKGNPKTVMKSIADIWLAHPSRRSYEFGVGFFPGKHAPDGYYNTFKGFAVQPSHSSEKCRMFLNHIRHVICRDNEGYYTWLVDWMADAVQDPGNPKGCAVVMKGEEGTGKGTVANWFGKVFGPHYVHLIDANHLTSKFNALLSDALLVFADEVMWGGNHAAAGKLKGMVTEKYVVTERKGIDQEMTKNYVRLMVASNEEWVVPAGPWSRRWFVLETTTDHVGDISYFTELNSLMNEGGIEDLLRYLLDHKITSNLYRAPETPFVSHQREKQIDNKSSVNWWHSVLVDGDLSTVQAADSSDEEAQQRNPRWPSQLDRMEMYESYLRWTTTRNLRPVASAAFYREMRDKFGLMESRQTKGGNRRYKFAIPRREECRKMFTDATGISFDRGDENDG